MIFVFSHIAKCSGSSMLHSLQDACNKTDNWKFIDIFAQAQIASRVSYENYFFPDDIFKKSLFDVCKKINIKNIDQNVVVHHHSMIDISDYLDVSEYIILVRDPMERAISHWRHTIKKDGVNISFEEFFNTFPHTIDHQSFWINDLSPRSIKKNIMWVQDYNNGSDKIKILSEKIGLFNIQTQYFEQTTTDRKLISFSEGDKKFINTKIFQNKLLYENNFLQEAVNI